MTDKTSKQKAQAKLRQANMLETLKSSFGNDLVKETGAEFMRQLFGLKARTKASGQLERGQSLEPSKALTGEYQKAQQMQKQVRFERHLLEQQKAEIERKNGQLQLQLHAITQEIKAVVAATPKLAREVQVAQLTSSKDPGIYHVMFLAKILEALKDFKKNIESASTWLTAVNKRANKKNFWNQYKVQKGTALLNPETYNSRSAG